MRSSRYAPSSLSPKEGLESAVKAERFPIGSGEKVTELIDAGKIKVFVNRTFPLHEAQAALDLKQKGKPPLTTRPYIPIIGLPDIPANIFLACLLEITAMFALF